MLNNNKYINQLREKIKLNRSSKIIDEYNYNNSINKLNNIENDTNNVYDTHNVIINNNKYEFKGDIKKYLPNVVEFNSKENFYNINNNKLAIDSFFNLTYDDNINVSMNDNTYIIMYYINYDIIPFIMLFMIKDTTNTLYTFPQININTDNQFGENFNIEIHHYIKDVYNYDSSIKGIKKYNNNSYVFTEIKKIGNINSFNKGIWALPHELINDKKILNRPMNPNVNEFIINNIEFIRFNDYEQPIVAYQLTTNDSEMNIFYTLDNFNKLISNINKNNAKCMEKCHRVVLFIGKLNINANNNDKQYFSDCDSIYRYDKYKKLSMIIIKQNKQIIYLSSHTLDEFK